MRYDQSDQFGSEKGETLCFLPCSQTTDQCSVCKSKKLDIEGDESDEDGKVEKLYLHCEECGATTEVVFE